MTTFAERLRTLREKQGISIDELAERIEGMTQNHLEQMEDGNPAYTDPTLSTMQRLADGLGVSVSVLVDPNVFGIVAKNLALQNQATSATELLHAVVEVLEQIPEQAPCAGRP